ncbi:hypothetical protein [Cellulophaga sp. BC115SP]|jgi:hypothetical protein|uniref:hypothetical protein n=1 Tax=Bacteroidota TaxID=976 RepID=UPI00141287BA|nr:hypothetical protein [Cellulophaga sp. BC115SP]NBB30925.1 hypothetical protein [Cellulophaga sp. BC115SP]
MAKKIDFKAQMKSNVTKTVTSGLISNENIKQRITILDELKDLIQPLQTEELEGLEANILANGCKDSLVIWQTTEQKVNPNSETDQELFVLVDGHNRYLICQKHNLPFNIVLMFFETILEARNYMLDLQMGRRNLSPTQMAYYRGLRYNAEKLTSKESNFSTEGMELKTSEKIAQQFKVDEKTIRRDGDFASGLEKLDIDLRKQVLSGEVKVPKKVIQQLSKAVVEQPISSIAALDSVVSQPASLSTSSSEATPDKVFKDINAMLKTVQASKSKTHFDQLKQLVNSLEGFMID